MSEPNQLFKLKDLRGRLAENNYKMTPQRKEILQVFIENSGGKHLSAEEVHEILRGKDFDFGLATVYRNVELLNSLGILTRVDFGDGRTRYELSAADPQIHHHHHLICLNCKKVIEFEEDLLDELEKVIAEKSGFKILNHEAKFFGYCAECQAAANFQGRKKIPEVRIISAGTTLEPLENTICCWGKEKSALKFARAYRIGRVDFNQSLDDCIYSVCGKTFTGIKNLQGQTLEVLNEDFELRRGDDGKKFLFHRHDIPVFDSGDREWDSKSFLGIFGNGEYDETFAIQCNCGYKIPSIEIYIGLEEVYYAELANVLVMLGEVEEW